MFNEKDITGEDLDAFESLTFQKIGRTGDSNTYPIIMGVDSGYRGTWIAVPVDDYEAIQKHFKVVDEQISRLEELIESIDGIMDEDNESDIDELMRHITPNPRKFEWADELKPSYLSDVVSILKDIEYKVEVKENYITVETYMHTISYGKHRDQRFLQKYYIGIKPLPLVEPSSQYIANMPVETIDEYVVKVKAWIQREKDIDDWSDYKIKVIGQAKDTIKTEIEEFIGKKQMSVLRKDKYDYYNVTINPFAFWISPEGDVPSAFQYLIEEDEL